MAGLSQDIPYVTGPAPLKVLSKAAAIQVLLTNPSDTYLPALAKQWSHLDKQREEQLTLLKEQLTEEKISTKKLHIRTLPDYNEFKDETSLRNMKLSKTVGQRFECFQNKLVGKLKTTSSSISDMKSQKYLIKHRALRCEFPQGNEYIHTVPRKCVMAITVFDIVYFSPSHDINCSNCIKGGACIYNFPLDALQSSVKCKSQGYFNLLCKSQPLNFVTDVLLEALEKHTSVYIKNSTFVDYYYWCEKLLILLGLCKRLNLKEIPLRIFNIHHVAASAVLKLIEEFQLANLITSLTLSSQFSAIVTDNRGYIYNPYYFNLAKYENLLSLTLDSCDYITLRLLQYCPLKKLSFMGNNFWHMFKSLRNSTPIGSMRSFADCCDHDIKGTMLSDSLRYLKLNDTQVRICSHFSKNFPNLTDFVTPFNHFNPNVSKVEKTYLHNPFDIMHWNTVSDFHRVFSINWQVQSLYHLEVRTYEEMFLDGSYMEYFTRPLPQYPQLKEVTLICDQNLSREEFVSLDSDKFTVFETIFTIFEESLQMATTVRLRNFHISNQAFNRLSSLQKITELVVENCNIHAEHDPHRTYFPSLTNVCIDTVHTEELINCLLAGGHIQKLAIISNKLEVIYNAPLLLTTSTSVIARRLCTLTELSIDIALLSDSLIQLIRALPNLRKCQIGMIRGCVPFDTTLYVTQLRDYADRIPSYIHVLGIALADVAECRYDEYYNIFKEHILL